MFSGGKIGDTVCPVCGNVIHSMGEAVIHCHGIQLLPAEAEPADEQHMLGSSPTGTTVAVVQWLATCVRRFWKESL